MTKRSLLFAAFCWLVTGIFYQLPAQRFQSVQQAEDTLRSIQSAMELAAGDSSRNVLNQKFSDLLSEALKLSASDNYPFDSLKQLVKITSPDNKFRIFHWNLPGMYGKQSYHGFIKLLDHNPPVVIPLTDMSDSISSPDSVYLDNRTWLGALYYRIIPCETASGKTVYTLLGWAGVNSTITHKVIEILYFNELERPHFGLKLFPGYQDGNMTRIIFRYSAATTMSLKYEKHVVPVEKKWNSKKRDFEIRQNETGVIVFDRLVPIDPQLVNQYQFYVPSGDFVDGFLFKNNTWSFMRGMDIRNKN